MATVIQVSSPAEIQQVQQLIREFTSWAIATIEGSDQAPTFRGLEEELATLPGIYAPPTGCLLLALLDGMPAGCVALKGHDATTGELKRLYVRPAFRGLNLAELLVAALVARARALGYRKIVLDSHISMKKAHAIYRSAGFRDVRAPGDFPDELKPVVVFMELDVEPTV
jgi:putative acetyltransferase